MPDLLLWDVDGTLIRNGGASKANYRLAFFLLAGREPSVGPETDGRTELAIMANLMAANGLEGRFSSQTQLDVLAQAGSMNRPLMAEKGWALPGAEAVLRVLDADPSVICSTLTGNIIDNAKLKLGVFGLDKWIDWECGAFGSDSLVRADLVPIAQCRAAERCGFDPAQETTVLIGDTCRDVEAGIEGGARVLGVATGKETFEALIAAGADLVIPDLTDTQAALAAIDAVRALGPVLVGS
jgi:phosphoglycolate phosphatase-like HAD superfamily hydrolase